MKNYNEMSYEEIREALFEEFDVSGMFAKRAFELAWEYGHSSGGPQVRSYFLDLVRLIKE